MPDAGTAAAPDDNDGRGRCGRSRCPTARTKSSDGASDQNVWRGCWGPVPVGGMDVRTVVRGRVPCAGKDGAAMSLPSRREYARKPIRP